MFVRQKRIGRYVYVYLVETVREHGQIKQRIIRNLGRKEDVERRGDLDRLVRSAARLAQRSMILSLMDEGSVPTLNCKRIGPPLLFERLWRDSGCGEVLRCRSQQPFPWPRLFWASGGGGARGAGRSSACADDKARGTARS